MSLGPQPCPTATICFEYFFTVGCHGCIIMLVNAAILHYNYIPEASRLDSSITSKEPISQDASSAAVHNCSTKHPGL